MAEFSESMWREFIEKIERRVNYRSGWLLPSIERADVVQSVLLKLLNAMTRAAFDSADRDEQLTKMNCWIATTTDRTILEHGRVSKKWCVATGDVDELPELVAESESSSRPDVERLLTWLNERERIVIEGVFFEMKSASQIAEELNLTKAHIRQILFRTLNKLREWGGSNPDENQR